MSLFTHFVKVEIIVTFLAILELMKQKAIRIMQKENFGDIFLFPWEAVKADGPDTDQLPET